MSFESVLRGIVRSRKSRADADVNQPKEDTDEIFYLLRDSGPLSIGQIVVDTLLPEERVQAALTQLKRKRIACQRPDLRYENVSEDLVPWGLDIRLNPGAE